MTSLIGFAGFVVCRNGITALDQKYTIIFAPCKCRERRFCLNPDFAGDSAGDERCGQTGRVGRFQGRRQSCRVGRSLSGGQAGRVGRFQRGRQTGRIGRFLFPVRDRTGGCRGRRCFRLHRRSGRFREGRLFRCFRDFRCFRCFRFHRRSGQLRLWPGGFLFDFRSRFRLRGRRTGFRFPRRERWCFWPDGRLLRALLSRRNRFRNRKWRGGCRAEQRKEDQQRSEQDSENSGPRGLPVPPGVKQHRRSEECDDDSRRGHEQGKSRHFRSSCSGVSLPPHGMKKMWPDFLPLSFS